MVPVPSVAEFPNLSEEVLGYLQQSSLM